MRADLSPQDKTLGTRCSGPYDVVRDTEQRERAFTMASGHAFGLPGVGLKPGDHICALYPTERERDAVLLPFLKTALEGDKRVCVVGDTATAATGRAFMRGTGEMRWSLRDLPERKELFRSARDT